MDVEYEIDSSKCEQCEERPCLLSCPVDAINQVPPDNHIEINEKCVGCVLCREACPYDAITMKTTMADPIRENVPNINKKLCRQCGACVHACKTGSIHLESTGSEEAHSVINEDTCVRCGYCARVCPTEAIKYGEILPRSVAGGKAVVVNQKKCIGCMTCTRVCPSRGAINVGEVSKLPYINPAYCARCEECMDVCPSTAIRYSSRKRAYKNYNKIKTMEIVSEILEKDASKLSKNVSRINSIFNKISLDVSASHEEDEFDEDVTGLVEDEIKGMVDGGLEIDDIGEIIEKTNPKREKTVIDENCIACGVCVDQCPVNCIKLQAPLPIHITEGCVFCGRCVEACPFDAVSITEEHFATRDGRIYFSREKIKGPRKGEIVVDHDSCQQCEVCINRCPKDALSFQDDKLTVDTDRCILCAECEGVCPLHAIKFKAEN